MIERLAAPGGNKETNLTDIIFGKMSQENKGGIHFQSLNSQNEK